MFQSIRNFLTRHRRKLITGGILVGGLIVVSRFGRRKLDEWHDRKTKEFLARTRKHQHFESTERTCNQTILSLFRSLKAAVLKELSTDDLVLQLQTSPDNKIEIWNQMKVISFSRLTAFVYGAVILVAILRVQLNLIGGYLLKDSQEMSNEILAKYLSLFERFLNEGLVEMIENIKQKVAGVVGKFDLKQRLTLQDVELLLWSVQSQLSSDLNDPIVRMPEYVHGENRNDDSELFRTLSVETCDLLESDELRNVCNSSVSRSFSCLIDSISEYYSPMEAKVRELTESGGFVNPNKTEMPMAKLIPIANGLLLSAEKLDSQNFANNLAHQLILNEQFKAMGANIYEAFCGP